MPFCLRKWKKVDENTRVIQMMFVMFGCLEVSCLSCLVCLYRLCNLIFFCFTVKGSCYALTYKTKIDQDNTAALLPNGMGGLFLFQ